MVYPRAVPFPAPSEGLGRWSAGAIDALVLPNRPSSPVLPGAEPRLVSEKSTALPQYSLFVRGVKPPRQESFRR